MARTRQKGGLRVFQGGTPNVIIDKESATKKVELLKQFESELVTGKFLNLDLPGKSVKLPYQRHKGDRCQWWVLEHNKVYTIPRGFANQLNGMGYDGYKKITWQNNNNAPISKDQAERPLHAPKEMPIYEFIEMPR